MAVMIPVIRKMRTALMDLSDNLGNPHNPCPLVQPDPICVPIPTKIPAINKCVFFPSTLRSNG